MKLRGGLAAAEVSNGLLALLLAALVVEVSHEGLRTGLVGLPAEYISEWAAPLAGPHATDAPPREDAGELDDVVLRVASVHADRVQLHELTSIVLVDSPWRVRSAGGSATPRPVSQPRRAGVRADGTDVVQIEEHRGMTRRSEHHIGEAPQDVGTDGVTLIEPRQGDHRLLRRDGHAQVVRPERHEALNVWESPRSRASPERHAPPW